MASGDARGRAPRARHKLRPAAASRAGDPRAWRTLARARRGHRGARPCRSPGRLAVAARLPLPRPLRVGHHHGNGARRVSLRRQRRPRVHRHAGRVRRSQSRRAASLARALDGRGEPRCARAARRRRGAAGTERPPGRRPRGARRRLCRRWRALPPRLRRADAARRRSGAARPLADHERGGHRALRRLPPRRHAYPPLRDDLRARRCAACRGAGPRRMPGSTRPRPRGLRRPRSAAALPLTASAPACLRGPPPYARPMRAQAAAVVEPGMPNVGPPLILRLDGMVAARRERLPGAFTVVSLGLLDGRREARRWLAVTEARTIGGDNALLGRDVLERVAPLDPNFLVVGPPVLLARLRKAPPGTRLRLEGLVSVMSRTWLLRDVRVLPAPPG